MNIGLNIGKEIKTTLWVDRFENMCSANLGGGSCRVKNLNESFG